MIEVPGEFLFIPKVSGMLRKGSVAGVFYGGLLFTPQKMFILPNQTISGAGNTVQTTTLSIDGMTMDSFIQAHADARKGAEELVKRIESWMTSIGLEPEIHILNHRALAEFKVNAGFFGGSIRYKLSKEDWADVFAMKSKYAARLREFLGLN